MHWQLSLCVYTFCAQNVKPAVNGSKVRKWIFNCIEEFRLLFQMGRVEDSPLYGFANTINVLGVVFGGLALISSSPVIFGISWSFMIAGVVSSCIIISRQSAT